jgi:PEP-CTERM motif
MGARIVKQKRGTSFVIGLGVTAIIAGYQTAHAQSIVYLPNPEYTAELHALGSEYGFDNAIYQLPNDPYAGSGNHHGTAAPATWSVQNHRETYCCGLDTHASSTTSNAGGGSVSVSVSSNNDIASATAGIIYYFTVIGPDAPYVAVEISGYGYAEASSPNDFDFAKAEFMVSYTDPRTGSFAEAVDTFGNHEHGAFSETIYVKPNVNYYTGAPQVLLSAATSVGSSDLNIMDLGYGGEGRAYIDPVFKIADPALASLYTFVGVPFDATAPAPVPEPATWALMMLGFSMTGYMMRRRKIALS